MQIVVADHRAVIQVPGLRDQNLSFDDVPTCLAWLEEKLQVTGATCTIVISDVALLLSPDQRAAFRELYDVPMKSVSFEMSSYNGPLWETILAFWWKSLTPEWRSQVETKIKDLQIIPGAARNL